MLYPLTVIYYRGVFMRRVISIALISFILVGTVAAQVQQEWPAGPLALTDKSDDNPVLVIGAIQTKNAALFFPAEGPEKLSFIRTQPHIGPRIAVNKLGFLQDSRVFLFDKVAIGETWQLAHYFFEDEFTRIGANKPTKFKVTVVNPLINGNKTFTFKEPGIYFVGSWYGTKSGFIDGSFLSELDSLKLAYNAVKHLPGWKKEIENRIKELTQ